MKILFIISALQSKNNQGGHYHSLNHISRFLGKKLEVQIITIGRGPVEILLENPFFLEHINFNGFNVLSLRKRLNGVLEDFSPSILHFFDHPSFNILRFLSLKKKYSYVLTKCGGPNPIEFPLAKNLILFSAENLIWFKNQKKFQNSNIFLIPNRVKPITIKKPSAFVEKYSEYFSFVLIARIGNKYKQTIESAIFFVKKLEKNSKLKLRLFIIGSVEDENIYESLLGISKEMNSIRFLTKKVYTEEASQMLFLADAVIGTGRGVMEATSLGLPVLTPAQNSEFPILIYKENFLNFMETNFSERNVASTLDLVSNFKLVQRMIVDKHFRETCQNFSFDIFQSHFNIATCYSKYDMVYKTALSKSIKRDFSLPEFFLQLKTLKKFKFL